MPNLIENSMQMRNQTWGSEWEMSNMTCSHCIKVVAKHYHTEHSIITGREYKRLHPELINFDLWQHEYGCLDSKGRMWWTHQDGSIRSYGEGVCELTTPIMTWDDIEDAQQLLRELREEGAVSGERYGCGLHIHIGAFNTTDGSTNVQDATSLRKLVNIMKSHEDLLIKAVNISASRYSRGGYANVISDEYVRRINRERPTTVSRVKQLYSCYGNPSSNGSRYTMLNYDSLDDNKTVEFRLFEFHNKMHAGELKAYIHLCMAMCNYAKLVTRTSPQKVDMTNEKWAMKNWLNNMGLIGDEFKTTRKMLTKRLSGDMGRRTLASNIDDLDLSVDGQAHKSVSILTSMCV